MRVHVADHPRSIIFSNMEDKDIAGKTPFSNSLLPRVRTCFIYRGKIGSFFDFSLTFSRLLFKEKL